MIVRMQQRRVSGGVPALGAGEAGGGHGVGQVVEGVGVNFGQAGAEEGADEKLEALEFGLEDDEAEVGFGVRVARLLFYELDLRRKGRHQPPTSRVRLTRERERGRGAINIPVYGFSPEYVPSRHPAMVVFLEHSAR